VKKVNLPEGDELGLPWERLADGLPHRLKRKRDFPDIDPEYVRVAAKNAAKRMGKAVQALPDRMTQTSADKYVWVQFADHEIRIGEPCKCGGRRLLRVHPFFARCMECNAQLLLAPKKTDETVGIESTDDEEDDEDGRLRPHMLLNRLDAVHLTRLERIGDRETYRGYARLGKAPVLVLAQFDAAPGEQLDAEKALDRVAAVQVVPLRQLNGLVDAEELTNSTTVWDLVL
jgi:hypothetical protein